MWGSFVYWTSHLTTFAVLTLDLYFQKKKKRSVGQLQTKMIITVTTAAAFKTPQQQQHDKRVQKHLQLPFFIPLQENHSHFALEMANPSKIKNMDRMHFAPRTYPLHCWPVEGTSPCGTDCLARRRITLKQMRPLTNNVLEQNIHTYDNLTNT